MQLASGLLMDKPSLPYYLTEGVAKLKKSGIDVDHLPLSSAPLGSKNGKRGESTRPSRPVK